MNVHDSERLDRPAGGRGLRRARRAGTQADVVVFNTCAVRENADNKLYGNLGAPRPGQGREPRHADRRRRLPGAEGPRRRSPTRAPYVDVVFGTHNIGSLPVLLERARVAWRRRRSRSSSRCRSSPRRCRPSASRRTPPGCRSRSGATTPARSASSRRCAARRRTAGPARSSPRSRRWSPRASPRSPCSGRTSTPTASSSATARPSPSCCARAAAIEGLERVRFTSPHPAEFTDDVIEAMAETPNVMPSLHMPLQSGSDTVLRAMRRSYRQSKYLGIIERVRAAIPDAAITTDIIVGFPGETEEDFQATLDVVRAARFSSAFTFQYSKRPGTPAAVLDDQVAPGRGQGPLPAPRRGRRRDRLGGEQGARRPHRRADGRRGRGPQGRRDAAPLRPRARQPARALRRRLLRSSPTTPCGPATW